VVSSNRTERLAGDLETWLRLRAGGRSLDVLRQLTDHAWFDAAPCNVPLADTLDRIARRTLEPSGPRVVLRCDGDLPERLGHFRWLSLLLPPDLLIAACYAESSTEPPADRVALAPPELVRLLQEDPVANTHLHLGAALHYGLLWTGLMGSLAHDAPAPGDLPREPELPPFRSAERFLGLLVAAAVARTQLAAFLWRRVLLGRPSAFDEFLEQRLGMISERMTWPSGARAGEREIRRALRAVATGELTSPLPRLTCLYRHLTDTRRLPASPHLTARSPLAQVIANDPLAAWLAVTPEHALPETRFAHRALRYLRGPGRTDTTFATLFWQYQRVRNLAYWHITQQPGTAGLDWFVRHYKRISPLRRALNTESLFESALALDAKDLRLGAIEVRTSPDPSWAAIRTLVRDVAARPREEDLATGRGQPEVALVLHLLKERSWRILGSERLHADPRQIAHGVRFGTWAYARLKETLAIEAALDHFPELLLVLRGIDLASTELSVPTWAALPFMLRLRDASAHAAAHLARRRPRWQVPPFRATCHAGEDYQRLVQGLRRLHEPIAFGLLRPGDRVGHAICLGEDPERWARAASEVPQPADERLDDLLWELERYAHGDLTVDSGRYAFARTEALRIGRAIFGEEIDGLRARPQPAALDLDTLLEARRLRHHPQLLAQIGYPFLRSGPGPAHPAARLVYLHLTDVGIFLRGQRIEHTRAVDAEVAFLRAAQAWLRRELSRLAITVESNPSSNLLLGDLLSVEEHPSFRMQPIQGLSREVQEPVLLSLNTDDPLTFSTALADEYAHLYGSLLRSRITVGDALTWLADRRDQGYRSRFTLSASADPDAVHSLFPPERVSCSRLIGR
jgi:hypothetical protein